jgi:hypothetical protein
MQSETRVIKALQKTVRYLEDCTRQLCLLISIHQQHRAATVTKVMIAQRCCVGATLRNITQLYYIEVAHYRCYSLR